MTINAGEPIGWTINVRNDGPSVARAVELDDELPSGLVGTPVIAGDCTALPCALGDLEVGRDPSGHGHLRGRRGAPRQHDQLGLCDFDDTARCW